MAPEYFNQKEALKKRELHKGYPEDRQKRKMDEEGEQIPYLWYDGLYCD